MNVLGEVFFPNSLETEHLEYKVRFTTGLKLQPLGFNSWTRGTVPLSHVVVIRRQSRFAFDRILKIYKLLEMPTNTF